MKKILSPIIILLKNLDMLITKIFVTRTFGDRDYIMNVVMSPHILDNEKRIYRDEKFHHRSPFLL